MKPHLVKKSLFFQTCFLTVAPSIFAAFLLACSAAGPLISPPWAMNPWCAPFFAKSKKVAEISSQSLLKWLPKWLQKSLKIDQKTRPKNNRKNHRFWLPKWSKNPSKIDAKIHQFFNAVLDRFLDRFWELKSSKNRSKIDANIDEKSITISKRQYLENAHGA